MKLRSPNGLDECWDYVLCTAYIARHILGEDERGDLLVPCVNWNKHHQCYQSALNDRLKLYNPRNPFHWRYKALSVIARKVVWVEWA